MVNIVNRPGKLRKKTYPGKLRADHFQNAFLGIPGTTEEMIIFNALANRGIRFEAQYRIGDISWTPEIEDWRADFFIPGANIIIEMYGLHWHTLPGAAEADAWRRAVLEYAGFKTVIIWDYELQAMRMDQLIDKYMPELNTRKDIFGPWQLGAVTTNDARLASTASLHRKRNMAKTKTTPVSPGKTIKVSKKRPVVAGVY